MNEEEVYHKRDIILARMDENLKHIVEWSRGHTIDDHEYQKKTDVILEDLKSFKLKQLGAVGVILVFVQLAIKYLLN